MNNETKQNNVRSLVWRQEKAIERLGGEKGLLQRLAGLFLRDTPSLLKSAELGIKAEDYDAAFVPLHSIKGTSSSFCADDFESACELALNALNNKDWQQAGVLCVELTEQYERLKPELEVFSC